MAASLITVLFLFVCQLQSASAELQIQQITAHHGDDVTLPCRAPNNVTTLIVEWSRSDLKGFVCAFQGRQLIPEYQDPSYVNRVQLKDDEMKNGDLSLILKNVNNNDEGTYECLYVEERGGRRKRYGDIKIFNFELIVSGPKKKLQQITAHPGDNVTLPCQAPNITSITTVEWIRSGLNGTVFQREHPSHVNRGQLADGEMKNGNLSLLLKDVKNNDEGAYVCLYEGMKGDKHIKLINIVYLNVKDRDAEAGHYKYALIASVILNVAVVGGIVIYKKCSDD